MRPGRAVLEEADRVDAEALLADYCATHDARWKRKFWERALAGRKVSGNAQQRKRHHLLHHGTLLYGFDGEQVGLYLRMPARQPEYRAGRGHAAFVRNLPSDADELRDRLRRAWNATIERNAWPREFVRELVAEKYGKSEWNRRR